MRVHEFTLLVEGADLQTDEAQDALFEAGCDDSTIGVVAGVQHVHFDREADSLAEVLVSAITAVEQAVPGVRVVRVAPDEYVTLAEIAVRTGRTRESVRLLATGDRGPGDFPPRPPVLSSASSCGVGLRWQGGLPAGLTSAWLGRRIQRCRL